MQDFQAFTIKFSARTNVLFSNVGISQAFDPRSNNANQPDIVDVMSIWDTGASFTIITKQLATSMGLIPTGKTSITGVNHTTEENVYFVNVYLPNKVCITHVKIAEVPDLIGGAQMLIGMDIIGSGDFSIYSEGGKTVMTYRFPSIGGVDFVKEAGNLRSSRSITEKIVNSKHNRIKNIDKSAVRTRRKREKKNKQKTKKK